MTELNQERRDRATASGAVADAPSNRPHRLGEKYAMWSPNSFTNIGCVNIDTLNKAVKIDLVLNELKKTEVKWDVIGFSESHWPGQGEFIRDGVKVIYKGRDDEVHREGVGFLLSEKAQKAVISCKPINSRLIVLRLNGKNNNVTIIQVYMPDSSHDDEEVETVYQQLQATIDEIPNNDFVHVMGDFNAKVGQQDDLYEKSLGKFGIGVRNERGERLLEFCEFNDLCVANTLHKHRKKYTWTSPGGLYRNMIDYHLVSNRYKSSVVNTSVLYKPDLDTPHELVMCKLKIKYKKQENQRSNATIRYALNKLKDVETLENYQITLGGRFQPLLQMMDIGIDDLWTETKKAVLETAESVLGKQRKTKQPYVTEEILDMCDEKRMLKPVRHKEEGKKKEYNRLKHQIEKKCRQEEVRQLEEKCKQCEESFLRKDSKTVYKTIKSITKKRNKTSSNIKDKDNKVLDKEEEVKQRWKDYYSELYNTPRQNDRTILEEIPPNINVDEEPEITREEVEKALNTLKNGKAAGPDGIPAELLKYGGQPMVDVMHKLMLKIWEDDEIPEEWGKAAVINLYKKGDPLQCGNYRGLSLLVTARKCYTTIIKGRMNKKLEEILGEEQAGFRPNRSTTDMIYVLRQIAEKYREYARSLYCNFIDFTKAFDTIWREFLWKAMKHFGFNDKIISQVKAIYSKNQSAITVNGSLTEYFSTSIGVLQGCILSPPLFNITLEAMMNIAKDSIEESGIKLYGTKVNNLRYADDIAGIAETVNELQEVTSSINTASERIGMQINVDKTNTLMMGRQHEDFSIKINNKELKQVNDFVYLGSKFTEDNDCSADIKRRLVLARQKFAQLKVIWKSKHISSQLKIRLFNALIVTIAIYGSETWTLTQYTTNKLMAFEMQCLRSIANVYWTDRITNDEVLQLLNTHRNLIQRITQGQRRYLGHMLRMGDERLPKRAFLTRMEGSRPRGRPRYRWFDRIHANTGLTRAELIRAAPNREEFKLVVKAATPSEDGRDTS